MVHWLISACRTQLWHVFSILTMSSLIIHKNVTRCHTSVKQIQIKVKFGTLTNISMSNSTMTCVFNIDRILIFKNKPIFKFFALGSNLSKIGENWKCFRFWPFRPCCRSKRNLIWSIDLVFKFYTQNFGLGAIIQQNWRSLKIITLERTFATLR